MDPSGGVGDNIDHLLKKLKSYDLKPNEGYARGLSKRARRKFGKDYRGIKKELASEMLKMNKLPKEIKDRLINKASRKNIDSALNYIKKECEANKVSEIERQRTFDSGHNQPERNDPDKTQDDRLSRRSYVNKEETPQKSKSHRKSLSSGADKISEQTNENSSPSVRESLEEVPVDLGNSSIPAPPNNRPVPKPRNNRPVPVPRKKQPTSDETAFLTEKKPGSVVNKAENPDDQVSAQSSAAPAKTKPPIAPKPEWAKPVGSYGKKNSEISSVCPAVTASGINLSDTKPVVGKTRREVVGGKGMFLEHMKQHGIPVPDFKCVGIPEMQAIERLQLSRDILFQSMPGLQSLNLAEPISLFTLKEIIQSLADEARRDELLGQLSAFISSDVFYQVVKDQEPAQVIRGYFGELCHDRPGQKIIVRSSGAKEDGYGDAQAGKYESLVHSEDDIVRTCLKVMASGYRPEICSGAMPSSMALVMQHCVDCQFGGVIMSYSSLKDDTVQIEYVPGQPKGAVAGQYGITPHRFAVQRLSGNTHFEHTPGNVTRAFTLEQQEGHGAIEKLTPVDAEQPGMMEDATARKLYQHIEQLENLLNSPVDAEFGINQDGEVKILQVRPVTRLQGGVRFSMAAPSESIAEGTLVSEGVCQGPLVEVKPGETGRNIPQGAIIAAHHGEDWMLAPDVLNKVGGFVFQQGGTGDHVAITLRQAGKPCLITGSHLAESSETPPKEVTLVCGEFNNQPGALLLAGSQFENLMANALPATSGDFSEAIARTDHWKPAAAVPERVDEQFQWLNEQNRRLLDYFNEERLLSRCLSPGHSVLLSMSPQRTQVLARLREEVSHFLNDTEALLQGYERYLQSGAIRGNVPPKIVAYLENLENLKARFSDIKSRVDTQLDAVTNGLMSEEELLASPGDFSQWRAGCQTLQKTLQQLSLPRKAEDVDSIHDVIFLVHKNFVDILGEVAQASGQGEQIQKSERVTFVNFSGQRGESVFDESFLKSISAYGKKNTVLIMEGALIINTEVNHHQGVIELIDNADGSRGRVLKVRMTDDFSPEAQHHLGKFKRFLLLAQTVNALGNAKENQGVDFNVNEQVGEITASINNVPDSKELFSQLGVVVELMKSSIDQDIKFQHSTPGLATVSDFKRLKYFLNVSSKDDQLLMFEAMLFKSVWNTRTPYMALGKKPFKPEFIERIKSYFGSGSRICEIIDFAEKMNGVVKNGDTPSFDLNELERYKECVKVMLVVDPDCVASFVKAYTSWLSDKQSVIQLVGLNGKLFKHLPEGLKRDKDIVLAAVAHSPMMLKYSDSSLLSDMEVLETAASAHPSEYLTVLHKLRLGRDGLLALLRQPEGSLSPKSVERLVEGYSQDREIMMEARKHDTSGLYFS